MTTQRAARVVGLAGLIVLVAAAAQAQDSAAADRGNAKYQYACAPCVSPLACARWARRW